MKQDLGNVWTKLCDAIGIFVEKAASRKFIAWVVATHLVYIAILDPNSWLMITMLFMGSQTYLDSKEADGSFTISRDIRPPISTQEATTSTLAVSSEDSRL